MGPAPFSWSSQRSLRPFTTSQGDRTTIAELTRPVPKLVSRVAGRVWLHSGKEAIAPEYASELLALRGSRGQIEKLEYLACVGEQLGLANAGRRDTGIAGTPDRSWAVLQLGVAGKFAHE